MAEGKYPSTAACSALQTRRQRNNSHGDRNVKMYCSRSKGSGRGVQKEAEEEEEEKEAEEEEEEEEEEEVEEDSVDMVGNCCVRCQWAGV